jgi:hypothetical protein
MRNLKYFGLFLLVLSFVAVAADNNLGIRDVNRITFHEAIRIGTTDMPAGDYVVRHSMDGENHMMAFERVNSKDVFKVKCTLVPLQQKAERNQTVYEVSGNVRVLHELEFRGDKAKHVF